MNDIEIITSDPQVEADLAAVMDHVASGKPLDPAVARRVQERGEKIRQEVFAKSGPLNVAVDLIREGRDEDEIRP
jgi:hypothetical protein